MSNLEKDSTLNKMVSPSVDSAARRSSSPPPLEDVPVADLEKDLMNQDVVELGDVLSHPEVKSVVSQLEKRLDESDQKYKDFWDLAMEWKNELMKLKRLNSGEVEGHESCHPNKKMNLAPKETTLRQNLYETQYPERTETMKRGERRSRSTSPTREDSPSPLYDMIAKMWPEAKENERYGNKEGCRQNQDGNEGHLRKNEKNALGEVLHLSLVCRCCPCSVSNEFIQHLFLSYSFAIGIWTRVFAVFGLIFQ